MIMEIALAQQRWMDWDGDGTKHVLPSDRRRLLRDALHTHPKQGGHSGEWGATFVRSPIEVSQASENRFFNRWISRGC